MGLEAGGTTTKGDEYEVHKKRVSALKARAIGLTNSIRPRVVVAAWPSSRWEEMMLTRGGSRNDDGLK